MELGQGRRIMVALGASEKGIYALEWALKYLTPPPPTLNTLTTDHFVILWVVSPHTSGKEHSTLLPGNLAAINQIKDACRKHNVNYEIEEVKGDAKLVICKAARRLATDLLVVGNHDYGEIRRLFQHNSSVGDYCVRNAKCPVVVVKSQVMLT